MLVFEIELNVAGGKGLIRSVVVFDVVSAETQITIAEVHVAIGNVEIPLATLRTGGGKLGDAAFFGGKMNLLRWSAVHGGGRDGGNERHQKKDKEPGHGEIPRIKSAVHAKHRASENSQIA